MAFVWIRRGERAEMGDRAQGPKAGRGGVCGVCGAGGRGSGARARCGRKGKIIDIKGDRVECVLAPPRRLAVRLSLCRAFLSPRALPVAVAAR
eukprot:scaffold15679_cov66-Phaeocystis_antarctica.AAC.1